METQQEVACILTNPISPHSLGTLIEWKLVVHAVLREIKRVPTRWGH
jgi:hypothetical protein